MAFMKTSVGLSTRVERTALDERLPSGSPPSSPQVGDEWDGMVWDGCAWVTQRAWSTRGSHNG